MLLHCTLVRSPRAALQEPPVELTLEGPAGASGAGLQQELAAMFGTGTVSIDGQPVSSLKLGEAPLVNGAVLVDAAVSSRRARQRITEPTASLALAVHGGAGAGLVTPLCRGTYTIGRSNADIVIPDADLSRVHARLVVTDTAIMIEDLDSANGTEVDGERQRNAVVTTNSTIRCGNSTMSLVFLDPGTQLDDAGMDVSEPLVVSRRDDPTHRAALLLTAVLPVIIGVGLALVTGLWIFLAFTAVSAASILVPVIGGRRQRRDLAAAVSAAVAEDQQRRRRAAPPLSALTIGGAVGGGTDGSEPGTTSPGRGIWLRLGLGNQPANLTFDPPDPGRAVPTAGLLPVTLDPERLLTSIWGPSDAVEGLVRSLLMQLAAYPQGRGSCVVIHGSADHLPLAARFLDGVILSSHPRTAHDRLTRGFGHSHGRGVLILLNGHDVAESLTEVALEHSWQVISFPRGGESRATADVELSGRRSSLRSAGKTILFVPDLAPLDVFNGFCRRHAREAQGFEEGRGVIPLTCRLDVLLQCSTTETSRRWMASSKRAGLSVPVGLGPEREQMLDLQTDGPHLLIAGTTGSGKSELLRSLTVALALSYPPERINFLFVDFKGGSGLGPLTGLPHCVGMLTDLSSHELERSLQSLRAEIRLRELALAAVQAPDLASYRNTSASESSPLPHLVVVIDEFRMLVDDAPEALHELMRIAAIGRSLGVHLIMATQRPQGALTPDIRANVTTSIGLRVQSEMESMDIINSTAAAGISVDTPGRAYLARGTEPPVEFQAGSLTAGASAPEPTKLSVRLASEYIGAPPASGEAAAASEPTPAEATTPLIESMSGLWEAMNGAPARKPVAEPLPCSLTAAVIPKDSPSGATDGWSIGLGLMDLPSEQRTAPLIWEPTLHGHLGFVGGPDSGATEAIRLAATSLAVHPRESHLYILDPDSSFTRLSSHGRVGARAGLHELRRAVRILERLAQEQSQRLANPSTAAVPLVLVIACWGSWSSALRSGPLAWAEDLVHDLVRDGGRAGIAVIISGERELVTARFFAALPSRVYFPTGSSEESRIAWPRLPATAGTVGRGVVMGSLSAGKTAVCQFLTARNPEADGLESGQVEAPVPAIRPFRIERLPVMVPAQRILDTTAPPDPNSSAIRLREGETVRAGHTPGVLWIGAGGDELTPVSVRLPEGGVLAVLGGPSSGKSSFLRLLPRVNPGAGPWLRPEPGMDPTVYWSGVLARATAGSLHTGSVALVDNADLMPYDMNRHLADLNSLGITVVLTAGYSQTLTQRVPLAFQARSLGTGLLIGPRSFLDGDLFGVRFEVEPNPPPGRSVLIQNGRAMTMQLGWVPPTGAHTGLVA